MCNHTFQLVDPIRRRYRCACGVWSYYKGSRLVAFTCKHELEGRKICSKAATHVDGMPQHNRCAEHAA